MEFTPSPKIYIKESPGKGLGVFAKRRIHKDEIVERCPVYVMSKEEDPFMEDYRFLYPRIRGVQWGIAWGYGSLYNHSKNPNCDWRDCEGGFEFFAKRDIELGEEICIYYGGHEYWRLRKHITLIE